MPQKKKGKRNNPTTDTELKLIYVTYLMVPEEGSQIPWSSHLPGHSAAHSGVEDAVIIKAEHVDASVLRLVFFLSDVSQVRSDHLSYVLDDHLVFFEVARGVQT